MSRLSFSRSDASTSAEPLSLLAIVAECSAFDVDYVRGPMLPMSGRLVPIAIGTTLRQPVHSKGLSAALSRRCIANGLFNIVIDQLVRRKQMHIIVLYMQLAFIAFVAPMLAFREQWV